MRPITKKKARANIMTTPSADHAPLHALPTTTQTTASTSSSESVAAVAAATGNSSNDANSPSDSGLVMFPVLATLARINVGDKLLSEGPELDVQPPAYLTPLYRWLGGESRSRNLARVSTQLGSMFDAVARTRQLAAASSFATMPAEMQEYFTNLETQLRAASTGLANLKETYTGKTADESSSAIIPGDAAKSQSDAAAAAEEIITLNNLILQLTAVANDIKTLVDSSTSSSFSSSTSTFVSSPAVAPTTETTTDNAATTTKTHAPLTRAKEAPPPPSNPSPTKNVQSSVKSQRLTWVDAVKQNAQSSATATAAARSQTASFFCDNINNNVNDDDYLDDLFSDDEFDNDNDNNDAFRSVQNTRKP